MKNRADKRVKIARARTPLACLVLAAGKGTRMRSARAKVMHTLLGRPMVFYVVDEARRLGADPVVAVLGHQRDEVAAALDTEYGQDAVRIAEQTEQRGTGHAVRAGLPGLRGFDGMVLILCGDAPLVSGGTLRRLLEAARPSRSRGARKSDGPMAMLTARVADPTGYGRIVRTSAGGVARIVEHKDASPDERAIDEINAGVYAVPAAFLRKAVARLQTSNAQGEFYLTDIVEKAAASIGVNAVVTDAAEIAGINDRAQLVQAEAELRRRINQRWMEHATLRAPDETDIEPGVVIEADAEIGRNVSLRGKTRIGPGARIGDGVILVDTVVGAGTEIKAYCVGDRAVVGSGCKIGPFAHLRPGTALGDHVHLGNFVETKNTRMGEGSKANHLSYLGDAVIGRKVNVGAGTITCNYNGYEKRVTEIDDGAFIGSDTQLVAPVKVGARAVVAAGATITRDVPAGALAISRVDQTHVAGYADRVAERYGKGNGRGNGSRGKSARPAARTTGAKASRARA